MPRKLVPGKNDILTTNPELAKEAYGWDPSKVAKGSHTKLKWQCSLGHIWLATPESRTGKNQHNCAVCANRQIMIGVNDLASTHPIIASQAYNWNPETLTAWSHKKVKWICSNNHIWEAQIRDRTKKDKSTGCPYCAGQRLLPGINDLATVEPSLAAQAYHWDPTTITSMNAANLSWICQDGHIWNSTVYNRRRGNGCPFCSGRNAIPGVTDLATTHPKISQYAYEWDASNITHGSTKICTWYCDKGHIYSMSIYNRVHRRDCPQCTPKGYKTQELGFLYLIEKSELGLLKIGITNKPKNRISLHKKNGWKVIRIAGPVEGLVALKAEQNVLSTLDELGAIKPNIEELGKFDGYTESWVKDSVEIDIFSIMDNLESPPRVNGTPKEAYMNIVEVLPEFGIIL